MPIQFPVKMNIDAVQLSGDNWAVRLILGDPPISHYQVCFPVSLVTEQFCANLSNGLWNTAQLCRQRTSGLILPNG